MKSWLAPRHASLEDAILEHLAARAPGATICPSEVARARALPEEEWRALMGPVRAAAVRLVEQGRLVILQKGRVVNPTQLRGPIRLRLASPFLPEHRP